MNFLSGTELGDGVMNAQAPAGCFSRVPVLSFVDAVDALLSLREVPPGRPDLVEHIPQDHDKRRVCKFVEVELNEVKKRASVSFLVNQYGLTDDDVSALICMKLEHPFPVYRWLNGWLQSSRRDTSVQRHVGPFFNLVYRALEKLPKIQQDAARSVIVNGIPALANTYNNYRTMLSPGKELSFWSWASFSTEDAVIGNPAFFGAPGDQAIVYWCKCLEGVDMEPFHPRNLPQEYEILPLCPMVFTVESVKMLDRKLVILLVQQTSRHEDVAYVAPKDVRWSLPSEKPATTKIKKSFLQELFLSPATAPAPLRPPPSPSVQAARPAAAVQQRRSSPLRPGEYEMPRMYVDPRPSLRARSPPRPTREEEIADVIFYNFGVKI